MPGLGRIHWLSTGCSVTLALIVTHWPCWAAHPICTCGYVKLWHGEVMSSENSQHLLDWYAPSHVLHGLAFYFALRTSRQTSRSAGGWSLPASSRPAGEVIENTSWIIDRYRGETAALDYFGDSIINSTADMAMMVLGFLIAWRAPVWVSVTLFIAAELIVGYIIRDGLLLNIIMLIWPLEFIKQWQLGA
jgi:hypothetical protein